MGYCDQVEALPRELGVPDTSSSVTGGNDSSVSSESSLSVSDAASPRTGRRRWARSGSLLQQSGHTRFGP